MQYLKNVTSIKINKELCTGCGMCLNVCPHKVINIEDRKATIQTPDSCMECGACRTNCPFGAIDVQSGVGCAYAIIRGMVTGKEPSCGCSCDEDASTCC